MGRAEPIGRARLGDAVEDEIAILFAPDILDLRVWLVATLLFLWAKRIYI